MDAANEVPGDVIDWVARLHALVDQCSEPVARASRARLRCRPGCADCCVDGLTVFAVEAALIRRHHEELLRRGAPRPAGACAFLDETGKCRIYEHRPYVCRTQGLPLRWADERADGALVESRDICPKNVDGGAPLEVLAAEECWTLGPFEQRLAARQSSVDGGRGERIALRSLFAGEAERRRLPIIDH